MKNLKVENSSYDVSSIVILCFIHSSFIYVCIDLTYIAIQLYAAVYWALL